MSEQRTRRRFLTVAGVGAGTFLTGCLGGSGDDPHTDAPETTSEAATQTSTATETETEPTPDDPEPMSTVFHFSSPDESSQQHAVANVANLLATDLNMEEVVLVANGKGIRMLTTDKSVVTEDVESLIEKGASFRACENSMSALGISESDLIDGVETVPAGVGELTTLQANGFAYIETP